MAQRLAIVPTELISSHHLQKPEFRLEDEITNLLENRNIPNDSKVKLLSQLILRYQQAINPNKDVITTDKKDESNIKTENPPITDNKEIFLNIISSSVPTAYRSFIPHIITRMQKLNVFYNDRGELKVKNNIIEKSNIVDLFSFIMRNRKKEKPPIGFMEFWQVLKEINIPKRWIGNKSLHSILLASSDVDEPSQTASTQSSVEISNAYRVPLYKKKALTTKIKTKKWKNY